MKLDGKLLFSDLTSQISMIEQGEISANELFAMQLSFNEKINPLVNAFISLDDSNQVIKDNDSALHGVAIAVKDNIDVDGFNTTAGLEILRHNRPHEDAFSVAKLRAAGASFIGKLNMHEGALGASNHNAHFGNCYNPHNIELTPGGSSGGSGAAVAAGMTALALGTDTMGSVRIPASYCGVFGFKGSKGAISNRGSVPCGRSLDNIGPLARSARDLTLAFTLMQGHDVQSAQSLSINYAAPNEQLPTILIPKDLSVFSVDSDVIDDFERNIDTFAQMGCRLKSVDFSGYDFSAARRAGLIICEADMRLTHQQAWQDSPDLFSPYLRNLLRYIDGKTPMDVMRAEQTIEAAVVMANQLFNDGDMLLMPTAPQRAFAMNADVPANQADLTGFANMAGLPALSMPMISDRPLPAGMQLVGPSGSDLQILAIAERWQQSTGFSCDIPSAISAFI
ncbi:amidase [Thalassotalea sp. HSM 43]|uniref:amidase n=1 Tax=Thalassotalea sp. HSM 43 TaxID=2552945 RepID=UPI00108029AD|nr:amidase [Thalassotalea sp. HSM 43]QBY04561.1 amidase [Thalassotalea sp. HSM 43]